MTDDNLAEAVEEAFDEGASGKVRGLLSQPQKTPEQQFFLDITLAAFEGRDPDTILVPDSLKGPWS